jgi:hypothetical protein
MLRKTENEANSFGVRVPDAVPGKFKAILIFGCECDA